MKKVEFDYKKLNLKELKDSFKQFSVVKISNLFPHKLCDEVNEFLIKNEDDILNKFKHDKKGCVIEDINFKKNIKYFDKPLFYKFNLFNKFINSNIFELSRVLLNDDVYLDRAEIHSRFPNCSEIPSHQDNAYFGLKESKSLTFYISLSNQYPNKGGLRYYKIPVGFNQPHKASKLSAFSLTTDKSDFDYLEIYDPIYFSGDCTVHHSTSIHFADLTPPDAERVFAFSIRMHSLNDVQDEQHKIWYEDMVLKNRNI